MEQAEEQRDFHLHGSLPLLRGRLGEIPIEILVLGTAAGGGFPQWNCRCANCLLAREPGSGVEPRRQSSVALNAGGAEWLLLNASPDLPQQMEVHLGVTKGAIRSSPFAGVFLTNADLDHALGLLLLREGSCLEIVAPAGVRDTLGRFLRFDEILNTACGVDWREATAEWQDSPLAGLQVRAVPISGAIAPRFAKDSVGGHGVGYLLRQGSTGKVVGFFPDVGEMDEFLVKALRECHVIFFDGTFWTDDELKRLGISERTAVQMGHVPISISMKTLAPLAANGAQVFYLHINNTNPILNPKSEERREIEAAGLRVAEDGMRLSL